jgi:hypothetical protein
LAEKKANRVQCAFYFIYVGENVLPITREGGFCSGCLVNILQSAVSSPSLSEVEVVICYCVIVFIPVLPC